MNSRKELIEKATEAQQNKEWNVSFDLWKQAHAITSSAKTSHGMARSLLNIGDHKSAYELYLSSSTQYPENTSLLRGLAGTCQLIGMWDNAEMYWEKLTLMRPNEPGFVLRLSHAKKMLGKYDESIEVLSFAKKKWPNNEAISNHYKDAQYDMSDIDLDDSISASDINKKMSFRDSMQWISRQKHLIKTEQYLEMLENLSNTWKNEAGPIRQLASAYHQKRDYEKSLSKYYQLEELIVIRKIDAFLMSLPLIAMGLDSDAKTKFSEYISSTKDESDIQHKVGVFINASKDKDSAINIVKEVIHDLDKTIDIESIINCYRLMKPPKRPLIIDWNVDSEVIKNPACQADDVFLVFTGYAKKLGSVPVELLDSLLAGYGASMVLLKDHSAHLYQNGIKELGHDFDSTIVSIRKIVKDYGAKRIFTIGSSGGGVGALRYGLELEAENILTFSGPTNLNWDFLKKNKDLRARAVIRNLNRNLSKEQLDLRMSIQNSPHKPRIDAYFGEENHGDKTQALNIEDLPNVHLHALSHIEQHGTIGVAFVRGHLKADIDRMIGINSSKNEKTGLI